MISILPLFIWSVLLYRFIIIGIMSGIWWFWIHLFFQGNQVIIFLFWAIIHSSLLMEHLGLMKHHFLSIVLWKLLVVINEVIVKYSSIIYLFALSFLMAVLEYIRWALIIIFVCVNSTVDKVLIFIVKNMMIFIIIHNGRL